MNKVNYKNINETLYHELLPNGLNVYLLEKSGFNKTYVTFSTNLGSLETKIQDMEGNIIPLPEGIAHFLEHKLFEQDGQDVSVKFAMNHAHANAYTQNNRTTYLFSCTDNLETNIDTLLNFVQFPDFTEKGIEKEKGVIGQEIKMYEDDPSTISYMGVLRNLYETHSVRNDILGTQESINTIDKDILVKTHSTFYHPKNMALFVIGNMDIDATIKVIRDNQENVFLEENYEKIPLEEDSLEVFQKSGEAYKDIIIPNYLLGIKFPAFKDSLELMREELSLSIYLDLLLGKSTQNYKDLLSENLINDSFGMDITLNNSYGYFLIGSESKYPMKLDAKLRDILMNGTLELDDDTFLKTKKQIIGGFIHSLNSLEYIANNFTKYHYSGGNLFHVLDISKELTKADIYKAADYFKNEDLYTKFTVYPNKK